jgi:hypothetical protein
MPITTSVEVIKPVAPPAIPPAAGSNELKLPQVQPNQAADRLPVIGSRGETIWLPRAIEGCWQGSGRSRLQYLGGCPNMMCGTNTPIRLRWCFKRVGSEPLTLTMARGRYGKRVRQRWDVRWARGQTIALRETISYRTMMFLQVEDIGDWTCRITADDQLAREEHEVARCGPARWIRSPWFSGSGWVNASRIGPPDSDAHAVSGR